MNQYQMAQLKLIHWPTKTPMIKIILSTEVKSQYKQSSLCHHLIMLDCYGAWLSAPCSECTTPSKKSAHRWSILSRKCSITYCTTTSPCPWARTSRLSVPASTCPWWASICSNNSRGIYGDTSCHELPSGGWHFWQRCWAWPSYHSQFQLRHLCLLFSLHSSLGSVLLARCCQHVKSLWLCLDLSVF